MITNATTSRFANCIILPIACVLALGIGLAGCEGPTGPRGSQGPQGSEGPVGPAGMDGSIIHAGNGAPADTTGKSGDYYLDMQSAQLYGPKTGNGWGDPLDLSGEDGQDGSRIYSGTTAPDTTIGQVGDYYLNKDTYDLYGPKSSSGWGSPINLQGPQGESATVSAGNGLMLNGDIFSLDTVYTDNRYIYPDDNGGFAVSGEALTGTIPAEGAGTRLMWYPGSGAFRAGQVFGTEWDESNIGNYSLATGRGTKASAYYSMAMGSATTASGVASTALGAGTTADGPYATALGNNTTASGNISLATGTGTTASGSYTTAMGRFTTAVNSSSMTIGQFNSANTTIDNSVFVVGNGSSGSPSDALVLDDTGNLEIAGTLTESSDARLKTRITPLHERVLGKLERIRPVRYRFRENTGHPADRQLGLLAQEVRDQFPELVSSGSNGYLSLSYSKFTSVLLKGLQEQQDQIENLRSENHAIKARLVKLEEALQKVLHQDR